MKKTLFLLFITSLTFSQTTTTAIGSLKINNKPLTSTGNSKFLVRNPTTKIVEEQSILPISPTPNLQQVIDIGDSAEIDEGRSFFSPFYKSANTLDNREGIWRISNGTSTVNMFLSNGGAQIVTNDGANTENMFTIFKEYGSISKTQGLFNMNIDFYNENIFNLTRNSKYIFPENISSTLNGGVEYLASREWVNANKQDLQQTLDKGSDVILKKDINIEGDFNNNFSINIGQNIAPLNQFSVTSGTSDYTNTAGLILNSNRAELNAFKGGSFVSGLSLNENGASIKGGFNLGNGDTELFLGKNIANSTFFKDSRTVKSGIEYFADYSADYTDRSLVDKGYVDRKYSNFTTPEATNLIKGKIQLSGDLGGTASSPTVPALANKENTIIPGNINQYYRGDKSMQTLDKTSVGLSNVDNTSDLDKPISTATQNLLIGKLNSNTPITGNTATKITYDNKGLVTIGSNATTADINDSTNRRYLTDAQQVTVNNTSNINTGDNAPNSLYSGLLSIENNRSDLYRQQVLSNNGRPKNGIIVPMYIAPDNIYTNTFYNNLIDLSKKYNDVPVKAILNVFNGPGSNVSPNYTAVFERFRGANIHPMCYVATGYNTGSRTLTQIKADIDLWIQYYPYEKGVFLDEMSNVDSQANIDFYVELKEYCHSKNLYPVIGNPGTLLPSSIYQAKCCDQYTIYESPGYPTEQSLKGDFDGGHADFSPWTRSAMILGSTINSEKIKMVCKYVVDIYVTDDTLPNPYDALPTYLEDLFKELSSKVKQDFKTINGQSVLGSGNLVINPTIPNLENNITLFSDFINNVSTQNTPYNGVSVNGGSSISNNTNISVNRPGITRISSSATVNSGYRWMTDVNNIRLGGREDFQAHFLLVTISNNLIRLGFHDTVSSADAVDGVYFEISSAGAVVLKCANNNVRTTSASLATLAINNFYKMKITLNNNGTSALGEVFSSNGSLLGSQTITTNIPIALGREVGAGIIATNSGTVGTAIFDLDYLNITLRPIR